MGPIGIGIIGVGLVATAVSVKIATTPGSPSTENAAVAQVKPVASTPIVIPVSQPQLLVVQTPPPPPPAPAEPPAPPPPRAAAPQLDIECTLSSDASEPPARCWWDRGFPAISADGSTIAVADSVGTADYPSLEVRFVDVATSRVIARTVVLDPKLFEDTTVLSPRQRAAVERRADRVQAKLVAGDYRSLVHAQMPQDDTPSPSGLAAHVAGDRIRIVDVAANTVLFERRYEATAAGLKPQVDSDGEVYCTAEHTAAMDAWWDARTRTLLTQVTYNNGGELCDYLVVDYAKRL